MYIVPLMVAIMTSKWIGDAFIKEGMYPFASFYVLMNFTQGAFHLSDLAGQASPFIKENSIINQNYPARLIYCDGL